jgi:tetratricopeptide (TPR) repeat protein
MLKRIAVVLFCAAAVACLVDTKKAMAEYEKETKIAIAAELIQDWPNAELHYNAALKAAETIPWNDGIFTAKQKLGDVYSQENKIAEAEKSYVEARDLCKKDLMCKGLDGIYDVLVRFYIYYAKSPEKAENVMDDMVTMKARLRSGADLRMRFKGYAGDMRLAGFNKEADFLNQFINQMPER